jgi:hypothetical protein
MKRPKALKNINSKISGSFSADLKHPYPVFTLSRNE